MKRSLLATTIIGGLSGIVLAGAPGAVWAQAADQGPPPAAKPAPKPEAPPSAGEVVVTGSRIRHTNYNSPAPIAIITTDEAKDEGLLTASQMLQRSTAAAGSVQINEQFGGYVVNGGPGVDTVSLRGLGSQRT
ncbi:MAG TPA: TonB-dependent receptor, partial [Caulobacteraceae bacterium]